MFCACPTSIALIDARWRRRGLTLVELSIGMVITSMVMGALSAVWFAMAHSWKTTGSATGAGLTASVTAMRLEQRLRTSRYVFQYASGSVTATPTKAAAIFYWKADNWNSTSDGIVQLGEMALIEHDSTSKRLYLYEPIASTSMTAAQLTAAGAAATTLDMTDSASPTNFKKLSFVKQSVISEAVVAAAFNLPTQTTNSRPLIEYTLKVTRPEGSFVFYGACSQRAAAKPG